MIESLKNVRKFAGDVAQCMKCGFCSYFCPVYREEKDEKALARGKNQLIRFLLKGEQGLTPGFYQAIDNCLLCKTCVQYCPAKTRIDHAVTAARGDYAAERGLPLSKSIVFRHILPHRWLFGLALRVASWFQFLLPRGEGKFRHLPQFLSALGAGRAVPEIAPKFLREALPERSPASGKARYRVGFFSGCATEYMFPEVGRMIVDVLTALDCDVVFDRRQGCCGAPVFFSGDFESGRKLALQNLEALEGYDYIVTGCATCSSGLREYPVYLSGTPGEKRRFEAFAAKVKDFNAFVIDVLAADPGRFELNPRLKGKTVTWHDPCHLLRHQQVGDQPRRILKSLEGVRFVEMPDADRCCGLGGSFSITHHDVSKKIADHKVAGFEASGADAVVTACPGCMVQLRDALSRHGNGAEVLHIGELFRVAGAGGSQGRDGDRVPGWGR